MLGLTNDIKVKIESVKDCVQTVSVELPLSKVKEKIEKAFESVKTRAKVPGFRPGKTPMELVRKNYQETAYHYAEEDLLKEGVVEAIKAKKIHALEPPVVQTAEFSPDKAFRFTFTVEVAPTFKVGNFKGLKLTKKPVNVTEDDVQKVLKDLSESNSTLVESKADSLLINHFAVVDYEGSVAGKPIQGASATNFLLDMSAPQAISGLVEGLVGAKAGGTREIPVTFPADSPTKELAGKEAIFKVKLHAIKEKNLRAVDDEFAKDMGLPSLEELKKKIRANLEKGKQKAARADLEKQIVDRLLEDHPFAVPLSLVEKQREHLISYQRNRLQGLGFPPDEIEKFVKNQDGEFKKKAEREVRLFYILQAIAEGEKVSVSEVELTAKIDEIVQAQPVQERAKMEPLIRGDYVENIRSQMRDDKLFGVLIAHAKVKEEGGA
ncbi:MAG: trigger factor [Elusimicrobia bacterium]|nr:trigger factor [Candidatus Obscuribacterium magneticum]